MRQIMGAAAALAMSVTLVQAAPTSATKPTAPATGIDAMPLVQPIASWRYHKNCGWRGGRWVVDLGAGRIIACRPNRPGRDYVWRNEGPRHGWYRPRDRRWYFDKW